MKDIIKENISYKELTSLKTPSFYYIPSQLEKNLNSFDVLGNYGIEVLYAIKANNHKPLVKSIAKRGYGFDVATKEELQYILKLGADPRRISFSAPSKLEEDIAYASNRGVTMFAFDSEIEAEKIMRNADQPELIARISTPNKDSVFDLSSKFGMSPEYYEKMLRKGKRGGWPIKGLTFHVGSQNTEVSAWRNSLRKMYSLIEKAHKHGFSVDYLNLGGGIPACYNGHVHYVDHYLNSLVSYVKEAQKRYKFERVFIEPGRSLCANTMLLATRIINFKPYKKPPLLIVDASVFGGVIEPLEHFEYPIYHQDEIYGHQKSKVPRKYYKVGGYTCEGYDIFKDKTLLPKDIEVGDMLILGYAGAYTTVYEKFHMRGFAKVKDL